MVCCSGEKGQQTQAATCNEFTLRNDARDGAGRPVASSFCDGDCSAKTRQCAVVACTVRKPFLSFCDGCEILSGLWVLLRCAGTEPDFTFG